MSAMEIRRVTSELLARGELSAAGKTLNLLEQERSKARFYADMASDICFEYDLDHHRLTFSEAGAQALGLKPTMTQAEAARLLAMGQDDLADIRKRLEEATYIDPDVQGTYTLNLAAGPRRFMMDMRTLWDGEDHPTYARVVGKLTALEE